LRRSRPFFPKSTDPTPYSPGKISVYQLRPIQPGLSEYRPHQSHGLIAHVGAGARFTQITFAQVGTGEVAHDERPAKVRSSQVGAGEHGTEQARASQIRPAELGISQ
jgi:hypothetical protein